MTAYGWLLIGAVIGAGHWAASVLPWIGGACLILAVPAAALAAVAAWAVRRERRLELLVAADLPDITAPLTAYEEAVLSALAGPQTDQDDRSSQ